MEFLELEGAWRLMVRSGSWVDDVDLVSRPVIMMSSWKDMETGEDWVKPEEAEI